LNFDGTMISSILPPIPVKADLRAAQLQASSDSEKRSTIAKALVQAKIARSLQVLDWLGERYDIAREIQIVKREVSRFNRAAGANGIRTAEGRVALRYWEAFRKLLPENFDFHGRMTSTHQNNASDPANLALNYAYGVLEGECRRAINTIGLEPSVGFLHNFSNYQTKQSLVYDLMEPFRWLADISFIRAVESGVLDVPDFYFTGDDYRYHFNVEAKQRFIDIIRESFNVGTKYSGRTLKWDTVIEHKINELGRFLTGRTTTLDFVEPAPKLGTHDSQELRAKILSLTASQAKQLGIGKSTLHYLRQNAESPKPLKVYTSVLSRLGV
jgi:CRISPR-associated protein Cas1